MSSWMFFCWLRTIWKILFLNFVSPCLTSSSSFSNMEFIRGGSYSRYSADWSSRCLMSSCIMRISRRKRFRRSRLRLICDFSVWYTFSARLFKPSMRAVWIVCKLGRFDLDDPSPALPNLRATYSGMHFLHFGPSKNKMIGSGKCF